MKRRPYHFKRQSFFPNIRYWLGQNDVALWKKKKKKKRLTKCQSAKNPDKLIFSQAFSLALHSATVLFFFQQCGDWKKVYVGETRRTAVQRIKEHKSDTSDTWDI